MPRPKVKPQDRQRSAKACDPCKASKKRCDANQPCRLCLKKGTQDTCTFTPTARDRRHSRHSASNSSQANSIAVANDVFPVDPGPVLAVSSQGPRAQSGDRSIASQDAEGDEIVEEDADSETDYIPDSRNSVERSDQQRPLMLSSSSGDKGIKQSLNLKLKQSLLPLFALLKIKWPRHTNTKLTLLAQLVFVGNTAALSFLRFLQKTLKHYVGPSGFTDRQHSHNWFEMTGSDVDGEIFYDGLDENEKKDLIHCFLNAVGQVPM